MSKEELTIMISKCREARNTNEPVVYEWLKMSRFPNSMNLIILPIKDNRFAYLLQDITQRIQLENELRRNQETLEATVKARTEELEKALHVKSRFLAIMSHGNFYYMLRKILRKFQEIRTPLTGITSALSMLADEVSSEEQTNLIKTAQGLYIIFLLVNSHHYSLRRPIIICDQ